MTQRTTREPLYRTRRELRAGTCRKRKEPASSSRRWRSGNTKAASSSCGLCNRSAPHGVRCAITGRNTRGAIAQRLVRLLFCCRACATQGLTA